MEYGIQMYSVRDITENDLGGALKRMAEIGYKKIEFAGFFGHTAEEVRKMLDDNGLEVSGIHGDLDDLIDDFEGTVRYQKIIGNKNYILPGADFSSLERMAETINNMNKYRELLEKEGITLGYHNHYAEFEPVEGGPTPYEEILGKTSVKLEIDTYWAYYAGQDPVAMMEELKDRLFVIHIKDGMENGDGMPLGRGTAPVKDVYRKALELGVPMVVESETLTPSGEEEARICFEYLKKIENGEA
ncbi:MAG: sugar phosphate isomerase/epimerase [Lachnospiraceae bacterium]|nr:sugar phosphate isomerase/epimerase [Lachnospiraceae bacterium]